MAIVLTIIYSSMQCYFSKLFMYVLPLCDVVVVVFQFKFFQIFCCAFSCILINLILFWGIWVIPSGRRTLKWTMTLCMCVCDYTFLVCSETNCDVENIEMEKNWGKCFSLLLVNPNSSEIYLLYIRIKWSFQC